MIPRYSRPQMAAIWAPENRFRIWFEIEAHACDAMADLGIIPKGAAPAIWEGGRKAMAALQADPAGNVAKIDAIERVTKHDVIAFLTWLGEFVGPQARFVHQGMTSSDVLDTSFAVQLTQAADILLADLDGLLAALKKRALEHRNTLTIGRSHGIHAEPTTFGVKLAGHYAAFQRNRARLVAARAEIATCAISGPVGTFASIDPRVEAHVARKLGLAVEPVSTQIIPRDRHAAFFAALGVVASSIENLATEIRHLQRTEVREAEEFFSAGQKGSSSMPHKRNPIGCARIRAAARAIHAQVSLVHNAGAQPLERGLGEWHAEWAPLVDTTLYLEGSLDTLQALLAGVGVHAEAMRRNLNTTGGAILAKPAIEWLAQHIERERATERVHEAHRIAAREQREFADVLLDAPEIHGAVDAEQLRQALAPLAHVGASARQIDRVRAALQAMDA